VRRHRLVEDIDEAQHHLLDVHVSPEDRKHELEWLRAYQRELEIRLRSMALDADIIGRRQTRTAGHDR
jgi:hypothetical protein